MPIVTSGSNLTLVGALFGGRTERCQWMLEELNVDYQHDPMQVLKGVPFHHGLGFSVNYYGHSINNIIKHIPWTKLIQFKVSSLLREKGNEKEWRPFLLE